jgi:hypothetical protein
VPACFSEAICQFIYLDSSCGPELSTRNCNHTKIDGTNQIEKNILQITVAEIYTTTLIAAMGIIPASVSPEQTLAGVAEKTGFRVKPGMTETKSFKSLGMGIPALPDYF